MGTAIGISVTRTFPTIPKINRRLISSELTNDIIRNNSKVIRKDTKKMVLTKKGVIKFDAM